MDYKSKHENIARILSQTTFENFLESIAAIEYNLCLPTQDKVKCLVPLEANFQLPNIFLKTKLNFKSDKLLSDELNRGNWNVELNKICEFLEEIELEDVDTVDEIPPNESGIEELIKYRFNPTS